MEPKPKDWLIPDKTRLLLALMEELAGNTSRMSFEGELAPFQILSFSGASHQETAVLKRNTLWPRQDFVVVPLDRGTGPRILAAIGGHVPRRIRHIQIERAGILEFGAYDSFDPECLFFGPSIQGDFLAALMELGVLQQNVKARK